MAANMSDWEMELLLIDLIQHYPFLFDKSYRDFKDNLKKNNAWGSIATTMATTAEDVQRIWRNLRERYAKERRLLKNIPSCSKAPECSWPLYKYMSFMEKHVASRKRVSHLSRGSSAASSTTSSPVCSPSQSTSRVWSKFHTICSEHNTAAIIEPEQTIPEVMLNGDSIEEHYEEITEKIEMDKPVAFPTSETPEIKTEAMEEESLITSNMKEKKTPDKNLVFGQYVGLTLMEMPLREQNYKKIKIMEILQEEF